MKNTPASWDERARTEPSSWQAASWSQAGQVRRFDAVYTQLLSRFRDDDTILDYGCGTGAFARFCGHAEYVGYDWSREMRERARREHPRATIVDELDEFVFDHVVCIGPFNLADNWSKEETWKTLEELWTKHTGRSLVVSLFRERGQTPSSMLAYSPIETVAFAQSIGCTAFRLVTDHLPNDLILAAFREPRRYSAPAELPARDVGDHQGQGV